MSSTDSKPHDCVSWQCGVCKMWIGFYMIHCCTGGGTVPVAWPLPSPWRFNG